jgi:hypothetical protein
MRHIKDSPFGSTHSGLLDSELAVGMDLVRYANLLWWFAAVHIAL